MENQNHQTQPPQFPNQTPSVANNSNKSKMVPIILGIAAVIVIAIGAYLLGSKQTQPIVQKSVQSTPISSPTPIDETANWKTYTNTKYDFSLKYPTGWQYLETPTKAYKTENNELWLNSSGFPLPQTNARADVSFIFTDKDPSSKWSPQYFNNYKSENYNLGNILATKISGLNKEGLYEESVIIAKLGNFYIQVITNRGQEASQYSDQILSTFRFTEDNSSTDKNLKDDGLDGFILSSPNGGEILKMGTAQKIIWNNSKGFDDVKIAIFLQDTGIIPWKTVMISSDAWYSAGTYSWTVPNDGSITADTKYKILITVPIKGSTKIGFTDETDGVFEIAK